MKIGYACTPLLIPYKTTRKFVLKNYNEDILKEYISLNLKDLKRILMYNNSNNIKLFRISSDIIPFGSHEINNFDWVSEFKDELNEIGNYAKSNSMRLSMHPGQYTLLNPENDDVLLRAISDLTYQCNFLDALGLDSSNKIILHVGGIYGDKASALERFKKNYNNLSQNIKNRLILENDEKNYGVDDLLKLCSEIQCPFIFDNLHNECFKNNTYNDIDKLFTLISKTWTSKDGPIKTHYSQQALNKKTGSHSQSINLDVFLDYYNKINKFSPDIMLEVKDKDISAIKVVNTLNELQGKLKKQTLYSELAFYKYFLLEKGPSHFDVAFSIIENENSIQNFYKYIDNLIDVESSTSNVLSVLKEVYKEISNNITTKEDSHFNKLVKDEKLLNAKEYLYKLAIKYEDPIANSYYFFVN